MPTYRSAIPAGLIDPEAVAIRALGFLAGQRAELERFLLASGLSHADFRRDPIDTAHLAAMLDFLIANGSLLLEFSRAMDVTPATVYEARRLFSHATQERAWPPYLKYFDHSPTRPPQHQQRPGDQT